MKNIKKLKLEKMNRGGIRPPDNIELCKKINEIIDSVNNSNTNPTFLIPTTKQKIENSLLTIFNEIDKIKNIIYSQIEHKNLSNTHDI